MTHHRMRVGSCTVRIRVRVMLDPAMTPVSARGGECRQGLWSGADVEGDLRTPAPTMTQQ